MLWMATLKAWLSERGAKHQEVELIDMNKDGELWQTMITHIWSYGTLRERESCAIDKNGQTNLTEPG